MNRLISICVASTLLLSVPAGAALTVHKSASGEKVVYDNDTGKYWYWDLTDFNDMNTPEQFAAIDLLNMSGYGGILGGWHMAYRWEIETLFRIESNQTGYNDLEVPWWWYEVYPHTPELLEITKSFNPTYEGGSGDANNWWGRVNWPYEIFPWEPAYYETVRLTKYISTFSRHEGYPDYYKDPHLGAWVTTDQTPEHVLFVREGATGTTGRSWDDAFGTLQEALFAATLNSDYKEIWVAEGTYRPGVPNDPRANAFWMINGVKIYGGFPEPNEAKYHPPDPFKKGLYPCLYDRDPRRYVTKLSGDLNGDDDGTVQKKSDNCYHVINNDSGLTLDATAVLDGFTITGGNANVDTGFDFNVGGGMYNKRKSSPTVTNCKFIGNDANTGGGMYNNDSHPTVTNCEFVGNSGFTNGGGMFNYGSNPRVTNCTFSANKAVAAGGGIYNKDSNPKIQNCILWDNSAPTGSGIHDDGTSSPTVTHSDVQGSYPGTGHINKDPKFVHSPPAPGQDSIWCTPDDVGDLRLKSGSPCIDTGDDNAVTEVNDLDGNPRKLDDPIEGSGGTSVVDMGAYEFMRARAQDVNQGDEVWLVPNGGPVQPQDNAQLYFRNDSGPDNATITVTEYSSDLHKQKHAYKALGTTLVVDTAVSNGQFFAQIIVPFDETDVKKKEDWKLFNLEYWNHTAGKWQLAVRGNYQPSPHGTPPDPNVGQRYTVSAAMPPTLSTVLGDYGVFWNCHSEKGFVWANVDHATDFAAVWLPGDFEPNGGVDFFDFSRMSAAWLSDDSPSPGWDPLCDLDGNGVINADDLAIFTARWLVGK